MNWLNMCINAALECNEIKEAMGLSNVVDKQLKPSCSNCDYTFLGRASYKEPCLYCHGHSHWEPMSEAVIREKKAFYKDKAK